VIVNELIATAAPVEIVTELRLRSAPEVPTDISTTRVVALAMTNAAQPAVPPAAEESDVMVFAVMTPAAAAPNAFVEGQAREATMVLAAVTAVEASAGWVPA
jgi:hypothetical protein